MMNSSYFSARGYQIKRELGQNCAGDRVAYLAQATQTQQLVVMRRFPFPSSGLSLPEQVALSQEIQCLKELNHSGIPRYLDSFKTRDSLWLVQEYQKAMPLNVSSQLDAKSIKEMAISILEILVYLQNCSPIIIHQAIRPENILFNGRQVYLVNFRLTIEPPPADRLYFLAPEQLSNQKLTAATDLYSLGITLISVLTKTLEIRDLIDVRGRIKFQHLMPTDLSLNFIDWLDTMVQPNRYERYPNAATALKALQAIELKRLPEVRDVPKNLELKATKPGEMLTQILTIRNGIPDTFLKGSWRVAFHANDPLCRPGTHAWITVEPTKFEGNRVECRITVLTHQLQANQIYRRRLLLETNSASKTYTVFLQVQTAALPYKQLPIFSLIPSLIFSTAVGWLVAWTLQLEILFLGSGVIGLGLGWSAGWGAIFSRTELLMSALRIAASVTVMMVVASVGTGHTDTGLTGYLSGSFLTSFGVGFVVGWIGVAVTAHVFKSHQKKQFSESFAVAISFLTGALGISLGVGLYVGFINPLVKFALAGTAVLFASMLLNPLLNQAIGLVKYYLSRPSLIKP